MSKLYTLAKNELHEVRTSDDIKNAVVVHSAVCPFCEYWHTASYSFEVISAVLKQHCVHEHREQLLKYLNTTLDVDQILIDNISNTKGAVRAVLAEYVHPRCVEPSVYARMHDVVDVIS